MINETKCGQASALGGFYSHLTALVEMLTALRCLLSQQLKKTGHEKSNTISIYHTNDVGGKCSNK